VLCRSAIESGGSCQYDVVGFGRGKLTGTLALSSMASYSYGGVRSEDEMDCELVVEDTSSLYVFPPFLVQGIRCDVKIRKAE
jgi:hypothetical protein